MKKIYFLISCFLFSVALNAQQELNVPAIPAMRQLHHDNITNALNKISKLNNKKDTLFPITSDVKLNQAINRSIRIGVNNLRASVELNENLDDNGKYKWLRGIKEMLEDFISAYQAKIIKSVMLPGLVKAYNDAMKLELRHESIVPVVAGNELEIGNILLQNFCLKDNSGVKVSKDIIVLKACQRDPDHVLQILSRYPDNSYADSLIMRAAFRDQEELYNYAAAPNALGKKIRAVNHPLVKIISQLAVTKTGRMYFPFLDDLYNKKISMDSITPFVMDESSDGYYKLLVKTRIGYAARMRQGDTPMVANVLAERLRFKAVEGYINEINALHDENNLSIRFKKLESLSPQELYYLAVLGEEDIYTSSFVSGVYPRIFERMKNASSDTLLSLVQYDFYKKFIKMSAAYNTLDDFLKRMDKGSSEKLMRNFVNGLDKKKTLEDAVDVADSYASIYNKDIRKLILDQVQQNLAESEKAKNKREQVIYNLLNTIFLSMEPGSKVNVSENLGIDPVYYMPAKSLQDTSGRIIMQQFFYGDTDGSVVFNSFLNKFRTSNWKTINKPYWVEVSSVKGKPVTIYANKPLDEKQDLDAMAQDSLGAYLSDKELQPTIVIHRGHSYYLQQTIEQLAPSAKVILLGSCGGYQKLNEVLGICPGAHIISSKQVGTGIINQGLIDVISEKLRLGKDLNWPELWGSMEVRFSGSNKEKFDDYVPPHKNLGAIFIMAYNKKMGMAQRTTNGL